MTIRIIKPRQKALKRSISEVHDAQRLTEAWEAKAETFIRGHIYSFINGLDCIMLAMADSHQQWSVGKS